MTLTCFECGSTEHIHQHHVVPNVVGGTKTIPLCEQCHAKVHGGVGSSILTRMGIWFGKDRQPITMRYWWCTRELKMTQREALKDINSILGDHDQISVTVLKRLEHFFELVDEEIIWRKFYEISDATFK